jgi:hypothetical protein
MDEQKNYSMEKGGNGYVCGCCGHGCCGSSYGGSGCGGWGGHRHSLLRILLAVALLLIVFWFGVKIGEVKVALYDAIGSGYDGSPMMYRGYLPASGNPFPMMGNYTVPSAPLPTK